MSAEVGAASTSLRDPVGGDTMGNRFLMCVIAFHRTKQLKNGAAPRIDGDSHKPAHIAVLEVIADTISWSRG